MFVAISSQSRQNDVGQVCALEAAPGQVSGRPLIGLPLGG
jgi:hypothetical protein